MDDNIFLAKLYRPLLNEWTCLRSIVSIMFRLFLNDIAMKMLSNRTGGWIPALIFAVLMVTTTGLTVSKVNAQDYNAQDYNQDNYGDYGDYQEFYDDLSPYGQWMNDPQYGYVWTPNVGNDFRPYYSNGYWVMTDYGNMWMSDYAWGWAPFHYGRWAQSSMYGWIWIPGRQWGPAWVNWRQGGGYYGWAPMGPGISINISFGSGYDIPTPWWTFIPCGNIYSRNYSRYYSPRRTVNIINNTTIINNTYVDNRSRSTYISGPRRSDVEAYTRQRVPVYSVNNRTRAGATQVSGSQVSVYRPAIKAVARNSQEMAAPRQVKNVERSVITNAGGGRPPARVANPAARQQLQNGQQLQQQRAAQQTQRSQQPQLQQVQRDQQMQQQRAAQQTQRNQQLQMQQAQQQRAVQQQRDQQMQQQRAAQQQAQRDQQLQMQQVQRDQQVQQQRAAQQQAQRDQQLQMQQQRAQQQQMQQQQRAQQQQMQQMQQQRAQQQQMQQQRVQQQQQMQQQRAQQQQQMQQQRAQQPQRSVERAEPQSVERSAPRGR